VWAAAQTNAGGTARQVTIDYAGTYTAAAALAGNELVYIGDELVTTAVAVGDTAATVATKVAADISAYGASLFTATSAAGVVTLTAKATGEVANGVQVATWFYDTDALPPSGTFATVAQTVAGATNPSLAGTLASLQGLDFTHVVNHYKDAANYALLLAEAQSRANPLPDSNSLGVGQNDFFVFEALRGTEAQITTHLSSRNSEWFSTMPVEPSQTIAGKQYPGSASSPFQFAAAIAATSAGLVSIVANKPHQNKVLSSLIGAHTVCKYGWQASNRMALIGASIAGYNPSGQVLLKAVYTERTQTDSGVASDADRAAETQFAKSYMRWSTLVTLEQRYPSSRLANDGPGLPSDVVTPKGFKATLISLAQNDWLPNGLIESMDQFKQNLRVERSNSNCDAITFSYSPDIVNTLRVKAGRLSIIVC